VSKVTLDDLRAHFEAARSAYAKLLKDSDMRLFKSEMTMAIETSVLNATPDRYADDRMRNIPDDLRRAAKLYVIARDEGLDRAMLWKLAN